MQDFFPSKKVILYGIVILYFLLLVESQKASTKKGIGFSSNYNITQLESLNVSWYYNWGPASDLSITDNSIVFVPMVYSQNTLNKTFPQKYSYILGFNEPDNSNQSNLTYNQALNLWQNLLNIPNKQLAKIGSPAMAGTSIDNGSWLEMFMKSNPKVDFICIHWYKGISVNNFIKDIKAIINKYNLPVWITEFAPQTSSSSSDSPRKYTQDDVNNFIKGSLTWMESESMVQRYAWHNSKVIGSTSNLFNEDGSLTETGKVYASFSIQINLPLLTSSQTNNLNQNSTISTNLNTSDNKTFIGLSSNFSRINCLGCIRIFMIALIYIFLFAL